MKRYWELTRTKIDAMSLRERAFIFIAAAFVLIAMINSFLLAPLLVKQQALSTQVIQQQEKMKELQAQLQSLVQAKQQDAQSPLRDRMVKINVQLQELDVFLQSRRAGLIEPAKMAGLLKKVLDNNGGLELVSLKTLPVSLLIEKESVNNSAKQDVARGDGNSEQKQIFKHGVEITVRGGYLNLMQYVKALEKLPAQMFWGEANLHVEQYPQSVLTLTLYSLSLEKIWLKV